MLNLGVLIVKKENLFMSALALKSILAVIAVIILLSIESKHQKPQLTICYDSLKKQVNSQK